MRSNGFEGHLASSAGRNPTSWQPEFLGPTMEIGLGAGGMRGWETRCVPADGELGEQTALVS